MNVPPSGYTEKLPLAFRCACGWMKYAPRGKAWVPRRIGRSVGRGLLHEFADYSFHRIDGTEWVPVNSLDDAAAGDYVALPPGWRRRGDMK